MNKEIANFFWMGMLSELEKSSINSFKKNGFEIRFWSYDNIKIDGIEVLNASEILKLEEYKDISQFSELIGWDNKAIISDIFRYKVLSYEDSWWFDCDVFCLKNQEWFFNLRKEKGHGEFIAGYQSPDHVYPINGACLFLNKQHAENLFLRSAYILEKYKNKIPHWGELGPKLISEYVVENNLFDMCVDRSYFYEILGRDVDMFLNPSRISEALRRTKKSYASHVWDSHLIKLNVDKNNITQDNFLKYLMYR
jgi:uncharacterized C2H2 Zn-finger protein